VVAERLSAMLNMQKVLEPNVSRSAIEELMEHFVLGALGLDIASRIWQLSELPAHHRDALNKLQGNDRIWAAWSTNRGPVSVVAEYDHAQAQRVRAHVLLIGWWMEPGEHHENWWHCYPKRPREWICGPGRLQIPTYCH
jgi:hypothetical protein